MQTKFNIWLSRNLTYFGRSLIAKAEGLSTFVHLASVLHIPPKMQKEINKSISKFIWNYKQPKIAFKTLTMSYEQGGIKAPDFCILNAALKLMWLKRLFHEEAVWHCIITAEFNKFGGLSFILNCNYEISKLSFCVDAFYNDILKFWINFNNTNFEHARFILWHNKDITSGKKSFFFKEWFSEGIIHIGDILDDSGDILKYHSFILKYQFPCSVAKYNKFINAIPLRIRVEAKNLWIAHEYPDINKLELCSPASLRFCNLPVFSKDFNVRRIQNCIRESNPHIPSCVPKWQTKFPQYPFNWQKIWTLHLGFPVANNVKQMQYKILHRTFPCRQFLFLKTVANSPNCLECSTEEDSTHYFYTCRSNKKFWDDFHVWWKSINEVPNDLLPLTAENIIFGFTNNIKNNFICNIFVLLAKWTIYKCKLDNTKPSLPLLKFELRQVKHTLQYMSVSQSRTNQMNQFNCIADHLL